MSIVNLQSTPAICGVGHTPYGRKMNRSQIDLAGEAIREALDDAGLGRDDLDGLIVSFGSPIGADADTLAYALGLKIRAYNQTWAHGRFTASSIQWAGMMVSAGLADVVACLAAISFSAFQKPMMGGVSDAEGAREAGGGHGEDPVFGMTSPGAGAALVARKYFESFGATSEQLGAVAVAFRKHASLNPNAVMKSPITVEDHQNSRFVCEPLHLLDYCLINDGAACVLVTTRERARDMAKQPVVIKGMQGLPAGREEFIWTYPGFGTSQQRSFAYEPGLQPVYETSGVDRKDLDALFTYDAFSILVWTALERFGFCGQGEAASFTQDGRIELGGELPMNTNGGLMSEGHIMGWNHQVEIVRQLRQECEARQIPDAQVIQWANAYGDSLMYARD